MVVYVLLFEIAYINGIRYNPNFGSVQNVKFTCDVYTNDSLHGMCFPTMDNPMSFPSESYCNIVINLNDRVKLWTRTCNNTLF